MLRRLIALFGVLAAFSSTASLAGPAADKVAQREREPFDGYAKTCGYPILYAPIDTISLARIDAVLGKIIVLDPLLNYAAQERHRRYLIAHECAHHILGHTTNAGLQRRTLEKGVEDQELSADCWAAEALVKANHPRDVEFMADAFYRKGLLSPGSGYPSGIQRSTLIYHCLKSVQRQQAIEGMSTPAQ